MQGEARTYLLALDKLLSQKCYESSLAEWAYATDINDQNLKTKLKLSLEIAHFGKEVAKNLTTKFAWKNFDDADLLRMYEKLTVLGSAALPDAKLVEVINYNLPVFF